MSEQLRLLPLYLTAHLELALFALLLGTLISVPLGVLLSRRKRLEQPILLVASAIQTIPSLALLALMVPLLAALHLPSIGYLPAFVALVLYSLLPVLRNTVTGLAAVDPAVIEAARAVGMTPRQQLLRVELPLALPVIVGGVRTAMAWTVGMATLSTPVGGASLGNYIFSGLQTRNFNAVLVGCFAAASLALLLDGLARLLLLGIEHRRRWLRLGAVTGLLLLYLYVAAALLFDATRQAPRPVVLGAKAFTEQYILSEILAERVRQVGGQPVAIRQSLGSTVAFDALKNCQIDAYVDYSGTLWTTILGRTGRLPNRAQVTAEVGRFLQDHHGVRVIGALGFENAYALAMRRDRAKALRISRLSELASHAPTLSIGADYEFLQRPEWKELVRQYGLHFATERSMDPSLMYEAIARENVDVISAFSSDGRIVAFELEVLIDDRGAMPPYDALMLAGPRVYEYPEVLRAFESLVGRIDADAMRRMNLLVDHEHRSPAQVAHQFLVDLTQPRSTAAALSNRAATR